MIRPDYQARGVNATLENEPGTYWTEFRIQSAAEFQFDVYRIASEVARKWLGPSAVGADVGCGYPTKLALLEEELASVTLFDQPTMEALIMQDFPGRRFVPVNLENPTATGERYDLVVCADVLEHLIDPDPCVAFLREMVGVGGFLVVSTPERDILRGKDCVASPKLEHVREWTKD